MSNPWKPFIKNGNNPWRSSSMIELAQKAGWNKRADFFKGTQGARLVAKHAWSVDKDLIKSIKENAETYIESPTSNRWIGKDREYLEPKRGMSHEQLPSTCIDSIIVDRKTSRTTNWGTDYKVSIAYLEKPGKYYDYWATEKDIIDLMNAPSKGREVVLYWNGHWEGEPGNKHWVTNPFHYYH